MARLRLLGRVTSINVRKVTWLLDLLRVPYDREDWGMPVRDPKVPEFTRLNPNAQVPVIIDDGFVLWESGAIMRYLADKHGSELWPAERQQRAIVDQWLTWQATDLNATWGYAVQALMRRTPGYTDPDRIAESTRRWSAAMAILEGQLEGRTYVANDRFSLADIALALSTHRWLSTPFEHPALPNVEAHYRRLQATEQGARYLGEGTP